MGELYTIYFKDGLKNELQVKFYYKTYERDYGDSDFAYDYDHDDDNFTHIDWIEVKKNHIFKINYNFTGFINSTYYANEEVQKNAKMYKDEILEFCKHITPGQKVEDGVIKEDMDNPVVTTEKIDAMFQKCKEIRFSEGFGKPYFIVGDPEMEYGMEYGSCVLLLTVKHVGQIRGEKEIVLEHFEIDFQIAGKEIMGYSYLPFDFRTYGHFEDKFEKELLPEIKKQLRAWELKQLFK